MLIHTSTLYNDGENGGGRILPLVRDNKPEERVGLWSHTIGVEEQNHGTVRVKGVPES